MPPQRHSTTIAPCILVPTFCVAHAALVETSPVGQYRLGFLSRVHMIRDTPFHYESGGLARADNALASSRMEYKCYHVRTDRKN